MNIAINAMGHNGFCCFLLAHKPPSPSSPPSLPFYIRPEISTCGLLAEFLQSTSSGGWNRLADSEEL